MTTRKKIIPRKNPSSRFAVGDRVQVVDGGVDSRKTGTVVEPRMVKTDGRGIPTNVEGAYSPVDWKNETAVKLDDGRIITMFNNRLQRISGALHFAKQFQPRRNPGWVRTRRNPHYYNDEAPEDAARMRRLKAISDAAMAAQPAPRRNPRRNPAARNDDKLQAWVGSWNAYNAGRLKGEWIDLSSDPEEIARAIKEALPSPADEEWGFFDYSHDLGLGENPSLEEVAEVVALFEEHGLAVVQALRRYDSKYWKDMLENVQGEWPSEEDFAESLVEDVGGVASLAKETRETYFDYEALGRDIDANGEAAELGLDEDASPQALGEAYVDAFGFPGDADRYFDMESFARDLFINDYFSVDVPGGVLVVANR